jgi:hypothetical protein
MNRSEKLKLLKGVLKGSRPISDLDPEDDKLVIGLVKSDNTVKYNGKIITIQQWKEITKRAKERIVIKAKPKTA